MRRLVPLRVSIGTITTGSGNATCSRCCHHSLPFLPTSTCAISNMLFFSGRAMRQRHREALADRARRRSCPATPYSPRARLSSGNTCTGASKCGSMNWRAPSGVKPLSTTSIAPCGSGKLLVHRRSLVVALVEVLRQEREDVVQPLLVVGAREPRRGCQPRPNGPKAIGWYLSFGDRTGLPISSVFGSGCAIDPVVPQVLVKSAAHRVAHEGVVLRSIFVSLVDAAEGDGRMRSACSMKAAACDGRDAGQTGLPDAVADDRECLVHRPDAATDPHPRRSAVPAGRVGAADQQHVAARACAARSRLRTPAREKPGSPVKVSAMTSGSCSSARRTGLVRLAEARRCP